MTSPWKGKAREDDSEELNPVITYRYLLSSGLGVRNPLRVCGLTDMDAFYAACEQNRLKLDPDIPLVVRQWDALIAVNYPARKFGITRMESMKSALEKCPHLHVVHVATFDPSQPDARPMYIDHPNSETHKVSLDYYRKESKKIMQLFKEMLSDAEVERASIDEGTVPTPYRSYPKTDIAFFPVTAFIDFTEPVRKYILSLMPHLATPPSTGLDTPLPPPPSHGFSLPYPPSWVNPSNGSSLWEGLGIMVPLSGKPPEPSQPKGTITESQSVPIQPPTPQVQASFRNDRQSPDGTRQTAPTDYSWDVRYEDTPIADNDEEQPLSDEEVDLDGDCDAHSSEIEVSPITWHDIALSIAASLLLRMRDEVKSRLGYTTSAGLARNKFLAKSILRNVAIPNYLRPIAFQKIRFLGGKLGKAIAEAYGANTVGDLLDVSIGEQLPFRNDWEIYLGLEEMQQRFGESSIWVWEILRGIDRSEVKERPQVPKSMAASKNLNRPIGHPSDGRHWLWILSGELAFRLQEARQENPGLWPKTLVLHIRHFPAYTTSRSKQAPFPFSRNPGLEYICKAAEKLWLDLVGTASEHDANEAKGKMLVMKVTNIALSFANVDTMTSGQRTIEGFLTSGRSHKKRKFSDNFDDRQSEVFAEVKQSKEEDDNDDNVNLSTGDTPDPPGLRVGFRCARCDKWIYKAHGDYMGQSAALTSLKLEHNDFHFAEDLAKDGGSLSLSPPIKKSKLTKKIGMNKESAGIERFFQTQTGSTS